MHRPTSQKLGCGICEYPSTYLHMLSLCGGLRLLAGLLVESLLASLLLGDGKHAPTLGR